MTVTNPYTTSALGNTSTTILATFKNAANANMAIEALHGIGVIEEDISLITLPGSEVGKASDYAATGAWQGAKLGLIGGLLVGVAAFTIPGLGALLAVGPLAASMGLTGVAGTAVTGAGLGALVGSPMKMGVPKDQSEAVDADLKSGAVLLSVKESSHPDVLSALQKGSPTRVVTA